MSEWAKRYLGWDHFPATLEALEIETFFTLAEDELAAIHSHRRDLNRLAVAIQIGYMRMTGMAPRTSVTKLSAVRRSRCSSRSSDTLCSHP